MNIFEIQSNIQAIYDELEENGGELTPELEEALAISKEDLNDKVKAYTEVIKQLQYDVKNIQEEKSRLDNLKKTKEKIVERLQNILLCTLDKYGDVDKRGVKTIDYGSGKISTRRSVVVESNEECINSIARKYFSTMEWLRETNQLDNDTAINTEDFLNQLNSEDARDITENQLNEINVDIDVSVPLNTLLHDKGYSFISSLMKYTTNFKTKPTLDKTRIKVLTKAGGNYDTIADVINKTNLVIK